MLVSSGTDVGVTVLSGGTETVLSGGSSQRLDSVGWRHWRSLSSGGVRSAT